MEAKELRIGNYLHDRNGNLCKVIELRQDGIYAPAIGKATTGLPNKPIELTEEWFLKLGFESNNVSYKINNDKFVFELYFYDAWNLNYVEKVKFGNDSVELSGYWKIHELQNLYFALTGEELTIKS
ncbi:hypothetical protein BBD31_01625 [Elizabethkingia anophelis]|uniref:hypothetical protein n=1 Tax=Elizabethkingia anophelis TaxID=1117645 RepID=UPI000995653F|nr:hypothetical protein [Elizabethkingia anophelis]AQW96674.1 hypothetical protein BBD31_01625 [Elizabethkingia anophelis]MDV3673669.1 hypothetical protein [Elizabethkingia anophelis]MDV3692393.1 hypothetical protein [Elizabethkingia anophelis]MDV3706653.1 hypothetical protein [Elizabethkingia anophelis]OPB50076.1 hypothetical protein BAY04_06875 [Elizabethkingia anophelis]